MGWRKNYCFKIFFFLSKKLAVSKSCERSTGWVVPNGARHVMTHINIDIDLHWLLRDRTGTDRRSRHTSWSPPTTMGSDVAAATSLVLFKNQLKSEYTESSRSVEDSLLQYFAWCIKDNMQFIHLYLTPAKVAYQYNGVFFA